jgi:NTE family protein
MRALVLSGGGCKGAFQVGALNHLVNDRGLSYDIICGVSVGALNTSFLSMYSKSEEKIAVQKLQEFWITVNNDKVWKRWFPFGRLHALWEKSLYNSQPLIDLIHKQIELDKIRSSGRKISVGAVSLDTGEYRVFTPDDDSFVDGVLASSAFPGGLKPIKIDNQLWTDGGVKHITPLKSAIDFGATDIDVIMCSPESTTSKYDDSSKTITLGLRTVDLMTDQINTDDLKIADMYNKLVLLGACPDKRAVNIKVIRPTEDLVSDSLNFDNANILRMISLGYDAACAQYK